jgi:P22 coat protein - gene protein 5
MATNTLATPTWVTKETARYFINDLTFLANVNRTYDDQYVQSGAKVGNTVNARLPQRFTVTDGQALQLQALYDQTVPITLTNQKNVAFGYSSQQATTELDNIRQRYVQPGAEALANAAEVLAFNAVYRDVYSAVGTLGTTPSATLTYLQAGTKLTDLSTPLRGRVACLDPLAMQTLANNSSTLFNPTAIISENYKNGMFGRAQLGVDEWYQDPVRPVHTSGTFTASTPLVNGASQTGSTININGWASGATTLNKGDIFTIAGVFSVNPLSYSSTGRLQQFVVTATTSDSTGTTATLPISPSIITSGQLQTVSGSPATGAAVTVWSANPAGGTLATTTSPQSFVYHPDAFAFVMADLMKPGAGAEATTVRSKELGFSIRMVEQYQIGTDQTPSRLDILIGAATIQARLACRVVG